MNKLNTGEPIGFVEDYLLDTRIRLLWDVLMLTMNEN